MTVGCWLVRDGAGGLEGVLEGSWGVLGGPGVVWGRFDWILLGFSLVFWGAQGGRLTSRLVRFEVEHVFLEVEGITFDDC